MQDGFKGLVVLAGPLFNTSRLQELDARTEVRYP